MSEQRIIAAVGTAVHSDVPGRADRIERAMAAAIQAALDEGVSVNDTAVLLERQRAARELALESE